MLTINLKRPRLTLAVALGLLAIAGPAGAGTGAGDPPSRAAHAPVSLTASSGGHPSQGAPTVGGGITSEPAPYVSPTPGITGAVGLRADKSEITIETLEFGRPGPRGIDVWETVS